MAFLKPLPRNPCDAHGCVKKAVCALYNLRSLCRGMFCRECGRRKLTQEREREKRAREVRGPKGR